MPPSGHACPARVARRNKPLPGRAGAGKTRLETLAYTEAGQFRTLSGVDLDQPGGWWNAIYARGTRALIQIDRGLAIVNTADRTKVPTVVERNLQGWGGSSLEVAGYRAYCALGMFGVATIDLE